MSVDPLRLTFDTLAATSRPQAEDVLIAALDVPSPLVRDLAAAAIGRRASVRGLVELIRRFDGLSDAARQILVEPSEASSRAFRQAFSRGDANSIAAALAATRFGGRVDQTAVVAGLLSSNESAVREQACEVLWSLTDRLYELLNGPADARRASGGDAERLRDETLSALAAACEQWNRLPDPTTVIERLLSLGTPRHTAVAKVLRQGSPECRALAGEVLATSRHPGVMRLVFEFFNEPYPPRRAIETLKSRDDPEFVAMLLSWFPEEPTPAQLGNFRQVDVVPWLSDPQSIRDVPEPLQGRLPGFLLATGLSDVRKTELQEWLVRNGSAQGRRGATQVFDRLDIETTRRILLDSLDSADEDVSAWATSQLRPRHVPGAFKLLIDRLDGPSEVVRQAAREQLLGFTVEHVVGIHDRLSPALCRQAGQLLRKIDPRSPDKLAAMIDGPVQRTRIAAAQAAARLGMTGDVRPSLLRLLTDEDNAIRRVGVEVLSADGSPEVRQALREIAADRSPRVRLAADRALATAGLSAEVPIASAT